MGYTIHISQTYKQLLSLACPPIESCCDLREPGNILQESCVNPLDIYFPTDLLGLGILPHVHEEPSSQPRVLYPDRHLRVRVLPGLGHAQGLVEPNVLKA